MPFFEKKRAFVMLRNGDSMENMLRVGVIASTHGIKGEVKVFPTTDDTQRFKKLKQLILDNGKERKELEIEGVKFFKQFVILKFKGIDQIEGIEKYKGAELWVTRQNADRLKKNEYYIADLIGMKVRGEDGTALGSLTDVIETGANDVYDIAMLDGRNLLLPAIRECVLEVHVEEGWMRVHILEGLLE